MAGRVGKDLGENTSDVGIAAFAAFQRPRGRGLKPGTGGDGTSPAGRLAPNNGIAFRVWGPCPRAEASGAEIGRLHQPLSTAREAIE